MKDIQVTLQVCRGGCGHYINYVCHKRGKDCTHRKRWIECLIFNGCDQEREVTPCQLLAQKPGHPAR